MTHDDIFAKVRTTLVDALSVDDEQVTPAALINTRPLSAPRLRSTARSRWVNASRLRPARPKVAPSVASTSASRSGRPDRSASCKAIRSSRTAVVMSPSCREPMPAAWWATDATAADGSSDSRDRAAAIASWGRDSASGSRDSGATAV